MDRLFNKKSFKVVTNALSTIILIISIVICFVVIVSTKSSTGMPNLFGTSILSVKSDSMEPTFSKGDLIFVKVVSTSERAEYKKHICEVGDVITFEATDDDGHSYINTHRIVSITDGERTRYTTKGDNVDQKDLKSVYNMNIIGKYNGKKIKGWGTVFDFLKKPEGVLVSVILPAILIIVWQIFSALLNYLKRKDEALLQMENRAAEDIMQNSVSKTPGADQIVQPQPQQPVIPQSSPTPGFTPEQMAAFQAQMIQAQLAMQQQQSNQTIQKPLSIEDERKRIIREYEELQKADEARKQEIIAEYLAQKATEDSEKEKKEKAEEDKIRAIVENYLANKSDSDKKD